MAEREQEIRHEAVRRGLEHNIHMQERTSERADRGQWLGFAAVVVLAGVALVAILKDQPVVGALIGSLDIASVAAVFVVQRIHPGAAAGDRAAGSSSQPSGTDPPHICAPPTCSAARRWLSETTLGWMRFAEHEPRRSMTQVVKAEERKLLSSQ